MSRVHVIAVIQTKPGKRDDVLKLFKANVSAVLAEDGCIEYGATVDCAAATFAAPYGPDTFVVVEKWASLDALKAHGASPHMKAYGASTKEMLAERTIHIMSDA
jgi:quinol monooxygenase YgiN